MYVLQPIKISWRSNHKWLYHEGFLNTRQIRTLNFLDRARILHQILHLTKNLCYNK